MLLPQTAFTSAALLWLVILPAALSSQTPSAAPASPAPAIQVAAPAPTILSSRAAYDEAMRPLELTRRDVNNWSEAETTALGLAIQQAGTACALRDPLHAPFDDLVDLARLCGVGQNWEMAMMAANRYVKVPHAAKPQLTQGYADVIEAELHLKMATDARADAQEMFAKVPYDATVSGAYNLALEYLQFASTPEALTLAHSAQPVLLASLKAGGIALLSDQPASATAQSPLTVLQVYRDALRLPALEIYQGHLEDAATLAAEVEAAMPAALSNDDALLVAAERRRFNLLGHPFPLLDAAFSLDPKNAPVPELPVRGLVTALLLFPDWCAQCARMGAQFPEGKFTVAGHPAAFFALLAQTQPSTRPPNFGGGGPKPLGAAQQLQNTPTLVVPATALLQFEASDFPLLLLVDSHGILRVHQPVGEDALQSGGTLDTAIANMGSGSAAAAHNPGATPHTPTLPR